MLRSALRASDFAGRWGGEEFLVLLPGPEITGAADVAENLRALISGLVIAAVPDGISASLGVASLPANAGTADELVRAADRALYGAKAAGRNRVGVAGADAPATAAAG